jgi:hypothetical protein
MLLLALNGGSALYGGWNLITHPDGSSIALSMHWLEHTPFHDYQIPGVILFLFNGVFSFVALAGILVKWRFYGYLILAQGWILLGWILVQIWMIQTIYFLHIVMGFTGIGLIVIGVLEVKREK